MSKVYKIYIWKKAPFLRILLPLVIGIILEYYFGLGCKIIGLAALALACAYAAFRFLPLAYRFKFQVTGGIIITAFMTVAGAFLLWNKDVRNHTKWFGNRYDSSSYMIATIMEPPLEKEKSYKVLASVDAVIKKDSVEPCYGKLLIYFPKDSLTNTLAYGKRILFKKDLQAITNPGNPGEFDYKRYCAARQIFYQCRLKKNDWLLLRGSNISIFKQAIFKTQQVIIGILDRYITGSEESGLARALLIGDKADLDRELIQAYSNAGVIHLIVIAGLHLGLIYALLLWLTGLVGFLKKSKYLRLVIILSLLWFFSLLTGASPPVLRAVVMFSFIAAGKTFNKNASVFNSLASSAFVLLCVDPFILMDAGFQLSYFAVTSIVITQRLIYHWYYFRNKILDEAWQIASVSLSAQVFTLPACLYYFHQMPLMFMLSNIVAIPIAIFILYGCVLLLVVSPLPPVAVYLGKLLSAAIWLLNHVVFLVNAIPFSLWNGFSISAWETVLLYLSFASFLYWLIKKNMPAFRMGICAMLLFTLMLTSRKWNLSQQKKIIVYNIAAHKAIDFVNGNKYSFIGDSDLMHGGALTNFNLKPARVSLMCNSTGEPGQLYKRDNFFQFFGKKILFLDTPVNYHPVEKKINVDYIIISKNPKISIPALAAVFDCRLYIFDASNPVWKIDKWKKECEELHLRFHSVPGQGAFITDL